jgi:hypothetical protein
MVGEEALFSVGLPCGNKKSPDLAHYIRACLREIFENEGLAAHTVKLDGY